jgi:hypothetical protein
VLVKAFGEPNRLYFGSFLIKSPRKQGRFYHPLIGQFVYIKRD